MHLKTWTAPEIHVEVNSTRKQPISVSAVQRHLRSYGLKECGAARKPLL